MATQERFITSFFTSYQNVILDTYYAMSEYAAKIINNSKISIFFYLGTPFLKNLTLNKPSIIIYPYRFKETINQEFLIFFKKRSKVFFNTTVSASIKNIRLKLDFFTPKFLAPPGPRFFFILI